MSTCTNLTLNDRAVKSKRRSQAAPLVDMRHVAAIILGGGQGTRLFPLTKWMCKPALCYGGRYCLIDIPISNAIHSGCHKIFIITQFLSSSLHQHIFKTYRLDPFSSGFIELLPAEEKHLNKKWFQGTADAVRQNLDYFIDSPAEYFLILSGDQLYNMDFVEMLHFAHKTDADLVIATLPIEEKDAKRMGVLKINADHFISSFCEKPREASELNKMRLSKQQMQTLEISSESRQNFLGSMGIYLFKRKALIDLLLNDPGHDFGKHLIPAQVAEGNAAAFIFQGYWEDIGTIESFYQANMALTGNHPLFNCYDEEWRIFACPANLPGPKIFNTQVNNSIICEGSFVEADEVSRSIFGPRTIVRKGSIIRDSYLIGNDFYPSRNTPTRLPETFQIGENCIIRNAIIDKHVQIGNGVQLINKDKLLHFDSENVYIRDGIIVVSRGASIPDGFII